MHKFFLMVAVGLFLGFAVHAQEAGDDTEAVEEIFEAVNPADEASIDEMLCRDVVGPDGLPWFHKGVCQYPYKNIATCEYDKKWISKCVCLKEFETYCDAPFTGVGDDCEGKYRSCCDTTCPAGANYTICDGTDVKIEVSRSECGDQCFACRKCIENCTIKCNDNQETVPTFNRSECGTTCVKCVDKVQNIEPEETIETPKPAALDFEKRYKNTEQRRPSVEPIKAIIPTEGKKCEVVRCPYGNKPIGDEWLCTACTATRSDCSTYLGWNCSKNRY